MAALAGLGSAGPTTPRVRMTKVLVNAVAKDPNALSYFGYACYLTHRAR